MNTVSRMVSKQDGQQTAADDGPALAAALGHDQRCQLGQQRDFGQSGGQNEHTGEQNGSGAAESGPSFLGGQNTGHLEGDNHGNCHGGVGELTEDKAGQQHHRNGKNDHYKGGHVFLSPSYASSSRMDVRMEYHLIGFRIEGPGGELTFSQNGL